MTRVTVAPSRRRSGTLRTRPTPAATDAPLRLGTDERATLGAVAERLIPAAQGMPSAAEVLSDDRLRFVLAARPDLAEPLQTALRAELGDDVDARLEALGRDAPADLYALQLVIVGGYYTDRRVRDLIGYPGQMAITVRSWEYPAYLEEGLIDTVLARGPVWRDPTTGQRAISTEIPRTYAERWSDVAATPEGGSDGHDGT